MAIKDEPEVAKQEATTSETPPVETQPEGPSAEAPIAKTSPLPPAWIALLYFAGLVVLFVGQAFVDDGGSLTYVREHAAVLWQVPLSVALQAAYFAVLGILAVLPGMRERRWGRIINIASRAAFRGDTPEYMTYAASKAGLVALTWFSVTLPIVNLERNPVLASFTGAESVNSPST